MICALCRTMSFIDFDEQTRRSQTVVEGLAEEFPSTRFDDPRPQYRPLNYLIEAFTEAKHFIHIATESLDDFFLGMLAMKIFEHDIEIRVVIVWHPQKIYRQLQRLWESSRILKGYRSNERPLVRGVLVGTIHEAHQELIVIEGNEEVIEGSRKWECLGQM